MLKMSYFDGPVSGVCHHPSVNIRHLINHSVSFDQVNIISVGMDDTD